ncbi:2396_t:CDS:2 [Scutellospora calospora]|uniref:2396_t:CDS:1 n=1 Tax=Scutellospora calospora TaxID=85575 RepID=A0ACA9LCV3_9GLOM|nr:2396_t:CDS:2 [Scutellospora calospora]
MCLKTSVTLLNILLIGFYSQDDDTSDQTLTTFSPEDILLVTGKFHFVEDLNDEGKKFPVLKIVLHHVIQLAIDPTDLPAFPLLINMTAIVVEPSQNESNHDDISLIVETRDFIDQDHTVLKLECYHLRSAQHLISTTTSTKKGSTLFMNGKLLIDDDYTFIVHLHGINFIEHQKSINVRSPTNLPWLSGSNEPPANESSAEKAACTIASRVKSGRRKKASTTIRSYLGLKNCPKITDLAKKALNQNQSVDVPDPSTP